MTWTDRFIPEEAHPAVEQGRVASLYYNCNIFPSLSILKLWSVAALVLVFGTLPGLQLRTCRTYTNIYIGTDVRHCYGTFLNYYFARVSHVTGVRGAHSLGHPERLVDIHGLVSELQQHRQSRYGRRRLGDAGPCCGGGG